MDFAKELFQNFKGNAYPLIVFLSAKGEEIDRFYGYLPPYEFLIKIKEMLSKVGYIFIGFSIVQLIDNLLIQPYIFSKSVKSHPLEVFIVIISSGILFGIIGLIIAIPLYTALKVIYFSYSGKEA